MASVDDSFHQMTLKSNDDNIIYMWKVHEASVLVVIADKSVGRELFVPHIEEALEIIEQGHPFSIISFPILF